MRQHAAMTMTVRSSLSIAFAADVRRLAANDDAPLANIVSRHLAARRAQRFLMAGVATLAALILTATILQGYNALRPMPDMVTFAARV